MHFAGFPPFFRLRFAAVLKGKGPLRPETCFFPPGRSGFAGIDLRLKETHKSTIE